ncbi:MAG: HD domain-containing phosphohydrolase [Solirubrobacteraceae bacterium]
MTEFSHMRLLLVHAPGEGRERIENALAQAGYEDIVSSGDIERTLELCVSERPDLVLFDLDVHEASEAALDAIRLLTEGTDGLPLLALSADAGPELRRWALSAGVRDFVPKPVDATELIVRVENALQVRHLHRRLSDRNAILRDAVRERTGEFDTARESLSILAAIADFHDDDTDQHAKRVGVGAALIAQALDLDERFVATIRDAAPLHDIGKVGISRRILLKPDKLTPAEWMHMMRHVEIGARILAPAKSPVLRMAAEIAGTHHERWDGNGYVAGLVGAEIPLPGRITTLADVWDTLTHERPYKPAWHEDRALAEITAQAGAHFDPRMVEAFLTIDRRRFDEPALADGLSLRVA